MWQKSIQKLGQIRTLQEKKYQQQNGTLKLYKKLNSFHSLSIKSGPTKQKSVIKHILMMALKVTPSTL